MSGGDGWAGDFIQCFFPFLQTQLGFLLQATFIQSCFARVTVDAVGCVHLIFLPA